MYRYWIWIGHPTKKGIGIFAELLFLYYFESLSFGVEPIPLGFDSCFSSCVHVAYSSDFSPYHFELFCRRRKSNLLLNTDFFYFNLCGLETRYFFFFFSSDALPVFPPQESKLVILLTASETQFTSPFPKDSLLCLPSWLREVLTNAHFRLRRRRMICWTVEQIVSKFGALLLNPATGSCVGSNGAVARTPYSRVCWSCCQFKGRLWRHDRKSYSDSIPRKRQIIHRLLTISLITNQPTPPPSLSSVEH